MTVFREVLGNVIRFGSAAVTGVKVRFVTQLQGDKVVPQDVLRGFCDRHGIGIVKGLVERQTKVPEFGKIKRRKGAQRISRVL